MARPLLLGGAVLWLVVGAAGLGASLLGVEELAARLPGLGIGEAALGRTIVALAAGCLLVGAAHLVVERGMSRGATWAVSAGVLLAAVLGVALAASAAALLTSLAAGTLELGAAIVGAAACLALAAGYGAVALDLVRIIGSRRPF